jgi:hypothetical protein
VRCPTSGIAPATVAVGRRNSQYLWIGMFR